MIIINPREVSALVLMSITKDGEYNNIALKRALKENGAMSNKDKAFVTEIVNGTLRNIFYIDYIIDHVSTLKTEKMKPWILSVIRCAVYQIVFMNVPESAAVNEAVKLVKEKGMGNLSGFTNGVLRNVIKNIDKVMLPDEKTEQSKYLHVKYSHPEWLIKMWLSQYSYDFVKELCMANNNPPGVMVMTNTLKTDRNDLKYALESDEIIAEEIDGFSNALKLTKLRDISTVEAFKKGLFHVQDISSAIVIDVLDPKEGETILDVCSAPGGKSFLAAEKMNNKGKIVSRDVFEHKLSLIDETSKRLGISIIETQFKDATVVYEQDIQKYDRVIVDAPCSGFGLLRKKPDIRLNRDGNAIDSLTILQRNILKAVSEYVKNGGILVYSTCTICKKENIGNIKWFVENFPYEAEDISSFLPEGMEEKTAKEGYVNLFPNVHGTDGFFIARLRRKG